MWGTFDLKAGDVINVVVGQSGDYFPPEAMATYGYLFENIAAGTRRRVVVAACCVLTVRCVCRRRRRRDFQCACVGRGLYFGCA